VDQVSHQNACRRAQTSATPAYERVAQDDQHVWTRDDHHKSGHRNDYQYLVNHVRVLRECLPGSIAPTTLSRCRFRDCSPRHLTVGVHIGNRELPRAPAQSRTASQERRKNRPDCFRGRSHARIGSGEHIGVPIAIQVYGATY
jgi:hypothetical protein